MQRERYSYFNYLNPFVRDTTSLRYACPGIRQSCIYCPSYVKKRDAAGDWESDEDWTDALGRKKAKGNWLVPANMDVFTSDFPAAARDAFIWQLSNPGILKETSSKAGQMFFLCTKDLAGLSNYWSPVDHVTWSYSASTQAEVDFYAQIRFGAIASPKQREALFLSPLVEHITLPDVFLDHFQFIFVDGYYGSREVPMDLLWIQAIADQLDKSGSSTQLIIEGVGDHSRLGRDPFKPKGATFWKKSIQELIES